MQDRGSQRSVDPLMMDGILIHVPGVINASSPAELTEIERVDKETVGRWKGEADTVLMFVCACSIMLCIVPSNEPVPKAGLFTGVVSVSLVESYKWLSPDSGDETVKRLKEVVNLITQTSHQFYNYSNGIPVQEITANTSSTFQPSPDVVTVNVFWFNSLVICLGCAILATLIQKWARRYLALTQGRGTPAERARVRAFLSNGLSNSARTGSATCWACCCTPPFSSTAWVLSPLSLT